MTDSEKRTRETIAREIFERDYPGYEYTVVDRAIYLQIADEALAKGGNLKAAP